MPTDLAVFKSALLAVTAADEVVSQAASVDDAILEASSTFDDSVLRVRNERVVGTAGSEALLAGRGNDTIIGLGGADSLFAFAGKDRLFGGSGNDTLFGGGGTSLMVGGAGADSLYGSEDERDVFRFAAASHSTAGLTRDVIRDYDPGLDDIDLRRIDANDDRPGNQAFDFTGKTPGAHSVWGTFTPDGFFLRADVNGDRVADFEVRIFEIDRLRGGDLLL